MDAEPRIAVYQLGSPGGRLSAVGLARSLLIIAHFSQNAPVCERRSRCPLKPVLANFTGVCISPQNSNCDRVKSSRERSFFCQNLVTFNEYKGYAIPHFHRSLHFINYLNTEPPNGLAQAQRLKLVPLSGNSAKRLACQQRRSRCRLEPVLASAERKRRKAWDLRYCLEAVSFLSFAR